MSVLRERARKAVHEVYGGEISGHEEEIEIGLWLAAYRAALDDATITVCWHCRNGTPFTEGGSFHQGKDSQWRCRAMDIRAIHAALAAEADKNKGEERT